MLATDKVQPSKKLAWRTATVRDIIEETPRVRTLALDVPEWPGHRPGQHIDVRLTSDDGYQAQRSYSISSGPEAPLLLVTVERIDEGEVSPYLSGEVRMGDQFEIRGPIGGHFVWSAAMTDPLFLVAGGSGVAPLMAMLRHRAAAGNKNPALLIYSSRSFEEIIYRKELDDLVAKNDGLKVVHTLTRKQPAEWTGEKKRIDMEMLKRLGFPPAERPRIFICGPNALVESAARSLIEIGHNETLIKTERFGPSAPG
jgi:ferredoxin-NADP reductase